MPVAIANVKASRNGKAIVDGKQVELDKTSRTWTLRQRPFNPRCLNRRNPNPRRPTPRNPRKRLSRFGRWSNS